MPESWEGVLILLAVTVITVGADIARRRMAPPLDPQHYVPPVYPNVDDYVKPFRPTDEDTQDLDVEALYRDYGGGEEDEGA